MEPVEPLPGVDLATLRTRKLEATQRLLGATIAVSDEAWQEPVALPGWTRAHVASHLARNADGLARLVRGALQGTEAQMYPGDPQEDIERGSERPALDLQIDLDTSAAALNDSFDEIPPDAWDQLVALPFGPVVPLAQLPLARLFEVEVHHVDLGVGYSIDDVDDQTAGMLLQWAAIRLGRFDDGVDARLVPTVGDPVELGNPSLATVTGTPQALLGWLTRRPSTAPVQGAPEPAPPLL